MKRGEVIILWIGVSYQSPYCSSATPRPDYAKSIRHAFARFFQTRLTVRLGTVASGMKIMIEISAENYDCLLSKLSEKSTVYAILKNGIASGSNEDRIIQIACEMTQAMALLQSARELFRAEREAYREAVVFAVAEVGLGFQAEVEPRAEAAGGLFLRRCRGGLGGPGGRPPQPDGEQQDATPPTKSPQRHRFFGLRSRYGTGP